MTFDNQKYDFFLLPILAVFISISCVCMPAMNWFYGKVLILVKKAAKYDLLQPTKLTIKLHDMFQNLYKTFSVVYWPINNLISILRNICHKWSNEGAPCNIPQLVKDVNTTFSKPLGTFLLPAWNVISAEPNHGLWLLVVVWEAGSFNTLCMFFWAFTVSRGVQWETSFLKQAANSFWYILLF